MSWFSEIFGEKSDKTGVPDLNAPLEDSNAQRGFSSYGYGGEQQCVQQNATNYGNQLDLNKPVEDSYEQSGYLNYGYGDEQPSFQQNYVDYGNQLDLNKPAEDSYAQHYCSNYGYCGEQPSLQLGCADYGNQKDAVDQSQQDAPDQGDGGEEEEQLDGEEDGEEEPLDGEEDPYPIIVSFETDQIWTSRGDLVDWVRERARENGYITIIQRSKDYGVWIQCSLGGKYKSVATVRKTGSKKIECPFQLKGVFDSKQNIWSLEVTCQKHNHGPIENFEGHALARRLDESDKRLVEEMADQGIPKRSIWGMLRKKNPERPVIPKDIHNAVQKIRATKREGESPMQRLEKVLIENQYTYYTRENQTTNAVEDIFFCHRLSYTMWCRSRGIWPLAMTGLGERLGSTVFKAVVEAEEYGRWP